MKPRLRKKDRVKARAAKNADRKPVKNKAPRCQPPETCGAGEEPAPFPGSDPDNQ